MKAESLKNAFNEKLFFKNEFEKKKYCRNLLYRRGYLISDRQDINIHEHPFYDNWTLYEINSRFLAYVHNEQHFYKYVQNGTTIVLIGHAYNPFSMETDEHVILKHCLQKYFESKRDFFEAVSELTGIHVIAIFSEEENIFVQDCTAMKACYYGKCQSHVYIMSHCALLDDIDFPTINAFSDKLICNYAFSHWGTAYLPGDITVFNELKRLGPNVYLKLTEDKFSLERFFPTQLHPEKSENDVETIEIIADLLKKSVALCAEKWGISGTPAISLSGGMDSRTTFSAASGIYDKFKFYSFYCKKQELDDANAAHEICNAIGVEHKIYPIADKNEDCKDFELHKKIISRNNAYVGLPGDHEIRKYIFLSQLDDFNVELKSWASEIGRAYWERRYGFKLPDKLTARDFSIFQTRFIAAPILIRKNDAAYKEYFEKSAFTYPMFNYEHTDIFYWEYRFGSNGTNVTMGQDIFNFEVTMPMNNRKFMDMFLWYPHDFRKNDMVHKAVILKNEPKFAHIDNDVHNGYFSKKRILAEKVYYKFRRPF